MSQHSNGFVVKCCMCGRVRSRNGKWYRRTLIPRSSRVSHTYCPACAETAREFIMRESEVLAGRG